MSIRIEYGGVAVGAKQDFFAATDDKAAFVDLIDLNEIGTEIKNFGNPCEPYTVPLDGGTLPIPSEETNDNIGWWSNSISDVSGQFDNPIVLRLSADKYYSSSGITIVFDTFNNIYATYMLVEWYRDSGLISSKEFYPNSPSYFCQNKVENYNEVVITITEINMPNARLRLRALEYGANVTFTGRDLQNARMIQEISPISLELPINTLDVRIYNDRKREFTFEEKQPMTVYFNDKLKGKMFVQSANQDAQGHWRVKAEDYIGILEDTPFAGGIYKYKGAVDIIEDIFTVSKVPYSIDKKMQKYWVSGYIPYTNCRAALMQVLFAIGAVADTSNSEVVEIFDVSSVSNQTVPLSRIMQGQTIKTDAKVDAVELVAHEYTEIDDVLIAYTSDTTAENVFVVFKEPLHDLTITNGEIVESGVNYAIVNAQASCVLSGKKYRHTTTTKTIYAPFSSAIGMGKVVSIKNATLISKYYLDNILDLCYNYYSKQKRVYLKIAEGRGQSTFMPVKYGDMAYGAFTYGGIKDSNAAIETKVGNTIESETPSGRNIKGVIERQSFKLVGGMLIKDTVMKEV